MLHFTQLHSTQVKDLCSSWHWFPCFSSFHRVILRHCSSSLVHKPLAVCSCSATCCTAIYCVDTWPAWRQTVIRLNRTLISLPLIQQPQVHSAEKVNTKNVHMNESFIKIIYCILACDQYFYKEGKHRSSLKFSVRLLFYDYLYTNMYVCM